MCPTRLRGTFGTPIDPEFPHNPLSRSWAARDPVRRVPTRPPGHRAARPASQPASPAGGLWGRVESTTRANHPHSFRGQASSGLGCCSDPAPTRRGPDPSHRAEAGDEPSSPRARERGHADAGCEQVHARAGMPGESASPPTREPRDEPPSTHQCESPETNPHQPHEQEEPGSADARMGRARKARTDGSGSATGPGRASRTRSLKSCCASGDAGCSANTQRQRPALSTRRARKAETGPAPHPSVVQQAQQVVAVAALGQLLAARPQALVAQEAHPPGGLLRAAHL